MRTSGVALLMCLVLGLPRGDGPSIQALSGRPLTVGRVDAFLQAQMESLGLPGLSIAIINDGRVVYHRALGVTNVDTREKVTADTLFDAGSMSKTPFAFLVMKLAEDGTLSLDQPLYTYLPNPDLAYDDRYKLITARMVLSHTSGLPNWRFLNKDGRLDIKFTPGTRYLYSGEGFEYLANVVAHLEGVPKNGLQDLFAKEVAVPLGMGHASYTWNPFVAAHQASGHVDGRVAKGWGLTVDKPEFGASYSLQAEAVGYANFIVAMIRGEGLKKTTYDEMLKPRVKTPADGVWYGLGIRVKPSAFGTEYLHDGYNLNFSSAFMFNRERRFGYVFFTNCGKGLDFDARLEPFLTTGKG
jgi:CubicO group peptidase (beta-lactamase class C family)